MSQEHNGLNCVSKTTYLPQCDIFLGAAALTDMFFLKLNNMILMLPLLFHEPHKLSIVLKNNWQLDILLFVLSLC